MQGTFEKIAHHAFSRGFPATRLDLSETPMDGDDILIATRLLEAFHAAKAFETNDVDPHLLPNEGIWEMMKNEFHREFFRILDSNDPTDLAEHLSQASRLPTTHGLGPGKQVFEAARNPETSKEIGTTIVDRLIAVAEAMAVLPYENPEQGRYGTNVYENLEEIVEQLETEISTSLAILPIMGRFGLRVGHRVLDARTADSAYVVWRLNMLLGGLHGRKICEIGAGLARTTQLCASLKVAQYTILDLPSINVLQGYYLIKSCGENNVALFGEEHELAQIRILPYWELFQTDHHGFDICINQDSFPEIPYSIAKRYITEIPRITSLFFSINQEGAGPTGQANTSQLIVPDLVRENPRYRRVGRYPYWVRRGYVEEIYSIS